MSNGAEVNEVSREAVPHTDGGDREGTTVNGCEVDTIPDGAISWSELGDQSLDQDGTSCSHAGEVGQQVHRHTAVHNSVGENCTVFLFFKVS